MTQFKNLRITAKFVLYFLLISLVPLSISIYISYARSLKVLKAEVTNSLSVVADNKANQIEAYLIRQKKEASTLSYTPEITSAIEKLADALRAGGKDSPEYSALGQELKPILKYYQKLFDYDDIILVNPDGEIMLSVEERKELKSLYEIAMAKNSQLADVFVRAKESQETEISNFEYDPQAKKAAVFVATPVSQGADLIGVVIAQMSNRLLYEFAQDYTGLGQTGETIIVSKIGDEAVFITPSRFDPEAEFKQRIAIGSSEGLYIQRALQPEKGVGRFVDYRGREVLAVNRYLPTFRLGIAVKMDTAEVFASARKLRNTLLSMSFLIQVVVAIIALAIAHSVSRPIKNLTGVAKTISAGELSVRAAADTTDEIGELATSFNQMTDSLVASKANVEQKKAEVEEQKRLLEEANKELDSFVYTVSHDLRAPLRGIDGFARLLEQDYTNTLEAQGKDYLIRIQSGAQRMKKLIDDLLTLSRISRIKNPYEDVDMNALVRSALNRIEFDIKTHNVELKIADNLPVVRCDRIKMEEVFFNLINNAIKFSSKNKDTNPRVEIGYADKNDTHEFYVKDNGIGIDKKYHQEVFGIFKRLHKQDEYEGTGAGLSICKRIIDDHKGSIWIDSEPGQGATFYITLPKIAGEEKQAGQMPVEEGSICETAVNDAPVETGASRSMIDGAGARQNEKGRSRMGRTILIIEDTEADLILIKRYLTQAGYNDIITADTAQVGIRKAVEEKPDLVISDTLLPGSNGFEVCQQIRDKYGAAPIKIIIMTGSVDAVDAVKARKAGADDYCVKTSDCASLLEAVKKIF
jgi:signal transduction histidine kinase